MASRRSFRLTKAESHRLLREQREQGFPNASAYIRHRLGLGADTDLETPSDADELSVDRILEVLGSLSGRLDEVMRWQRTMARKMGIDQREIDTKYQRQQPVEAMPAGFERA